MAYRAGIVKGKTAEAGTILQRDPLSAECQLVRIERTGNLYPILLHEPLTREGDPPCHEAGRSPRRGASSRQSWTPPAPASRSSSGAATAARLSSYRDPISMPRVRT